MTPLLTTARVLAGTVTAGLVLTALGACSQAHHSDPAATRPAAAVTTMAAAAPTTPAAAPQQPATGTPPAAQSAPARSAPAQGVPPAQGDPLAPAPQPSLSALPAAPAGFTEACAPAALLAYVRTQPGPVTGFGEVKVYACVGGYARLYAKASPAPSGERPDGDQFFLQYSHGQWRTLARGAGLGCGDGTAEIAQACAVLDFAARH
ncbi:hypothetical protein [Dactylosporangium sp. NPDC000521]|uniref:hypothetical protein n=1 Tax=Dactylosporangium sp. NPDC000521 TaxID=3363975 RepID=UPI0036AD1B88